MLRTKKVDLSEETSCARAKASPAARLHLRMTTKASRLALCFPLLFAASCFRPRSMCQELCPPGRTCTVPECIRVDAGADVPDAELDADASTAQNDDALDADSGVDGDAGIDADAGLDGEGPIDHTDGPPAEMEVGNDAEAGSDTRDTGYDVDGNGDADARDSNNCHSNETEPPVTTCMIGGCVTLSADVRAGVVLWLDPSNLPQATGSRVFTWCDQSGHLNDAHATDDSVPPISIETGGVMLPYGSVGTGLVVANSPSINLGAGDFLILMVAGIFHDGIGKSLFIKSDGEFDFPKQTDIEWLSYVPEGFRLTGTVNDTPAISDTATDPGTERLFGLRRVGNQIELRVNSQKVSSVPLLTPGTSTENADDLYLGVGGYPDIYPVDTIRAVIVVSGPLSDTEVGSLEGDLLRALRL